MPDPLRPAAVAATLRTIRARRPLVHCIGNDVVLNTLANALLALGASPAMVDAEEESGVLAAGAGAVAINLGTVTAPQFRAMVVAAAAARNAGVPWVLDPVAIGLLPFRTACAIELLEHRPTAIRGNASEIMALDAALSGAEAVSGHGVDSAHAADAARPAAASLSARTGATVSVSGATDWIASDARFARINNGDPLLTRVTGMGCAATAILAACLAVVPDPFAAAAHAAVLGGLAGEHAAARARGPGSMAVEFLDALWRLDDDTLTSDARLAPGNPASFGPASAFATTPPPVSGDPPAPPAGPGPGSGPV